MSSSSTRWASACPRYVSCRWGGSTDIRTLQGFAGGQVMLRDEATCIDQANGPAFYRSLSRTQQKPNGIL